MNSKPVLTSAQKKWIEALRSGKYKQGKGFLKKDNCFCCLGVACDIFKEELNLTVTDEGYHGYAEILPPKVAEYLNLISDVGNNICNDKDSLATLNDDGMSFEEIANEIETGAYFRTEEMD